MAILAMWPDAHEKTFIPPSNTGSTFSLLSISLAVLEEKVKKKTESEESRTKVSKWSWPLVFIKNHLGYCIYQLWMSQATIASGKSTVCLFHIQKPMWPISPYCKIGQGQPRVIIWTNLKEPESRMLHIKFQGHRPFSSWEEDIQRFLPYMAMAAGLVMWPRPYEQTFFPHSMKAPHVIWFQLA